MKTNAKLGLGMYPYLRFSESLDATGQRWTSFSGVGSREVLFDITRKVAPQRLEQLRGVARKASDLRLEIALRSAPKADVVRVQATGGLTGDDVEALKHVEACIYQDLRRQVGRKR
jgi:hypothetical protein